MDRKHTLSGILALLLIIAASQINAMPVGLCGVNLPTPQAPAGGNANVNVTIDTCDVSESQIVEATLSGGSPIPIGPIDGMDAAAIGSALIEAAALLGQSPASLQIVALTLVNETMNLVEEVFSASSNTPALLGVDYIGDPNDYTTWIAIGSVNVEVAVSQATVTTQTYRLELTEVTAVSLPASILLLLMGLAVLVVARASGRPDSSKFWSVTSERASHSG